jgi:hypothetical protein
MHKLTLSIQEIADGHWMSSIAFEGGIFKHGILVVALRADTHILLAEMPRHLVKAGNLLDCALDIALNK